MSIDISQYDNKIRCHPVSSANMSGFELWVYLAVKISSLDQITYYDVAIFSP
jgi:hypothetical protein